MRLGRGKMVKIKWTEMKKNKEVLELEKKNIAKQLKGSKRWRIMLGHTLRRIPWNHTGRVVITRKRKWPRTCRYMSQV